MQKYIVLYYSPAGAMEKMKTAKKEEMQQGQKAWMDWFENIGDKLADQGKFFKQGSEISSSGDQDCTGKVTGYSIIQAESFESAKELLADHPHLAWFEGCSLEVYEPQQMGK